MRVAIEHELARPCDSEPGQSAGGISVVKKNVCIALRTAIVLALASSTTARAGEVIEANRLRQNLYSTCFVSEDEGWAVGDLGRIFHTTNGGLSWEIQDSGTKRPFVAITCVTNK